MKKGGLRATFPAVLEWTTSAGSVTRIRACKVADRNGGRVPGRGCYNGFPHLIARIEDIEEAFGRTTYYGTLYVR